MDGALLVRVKFLFVLVSCIPVYFHAQGVKLQLSHCTVDIGSVVVYCCRATKLYPTLLTQIALPPPPFQPARLKTKQSENELALGCLSQPAWTPTSASPQRAKNEFWSLWLVWFLFPDSFRDGIMLTGVSGTETEWPLITLVLIDNWFSYSFSVITQVFINSTPTR